MDKKKGDRFYDGRSTSSSSDSSHGPIGKLGLLRGESSNPNKGLATIQGPSSRVDPVCLDFSWADSVVRKDGLSNEPMLSCEPYEVGDQGVCSDFSNLEHRGEVFHIDLRGDAGPSRKFTKLRKGSHRLKLKGKEVKKVQLMMKKGLLKTSLVRFWIGQWRRRLVKSGVGVIQGREGETEQALDAEGDCAAGNVKDPQARDLHPEVLNSNSSVYGECDQGTRVVDVEGNEVEWHLDGEISRVLEIGAALNCNPRGVGWSEEPEMVIDVEGNSVAWSLEAEIAGVLEVAAALGIDCGSNREAIRGEISRREKEDLIRLRGAKDS